MTLTQFFLQQPKEEKQKTKTKTLNTVHTAEKVTQITSQKMNDQDHPENIYISHTKYKQNPDSKTEN